MEISNSLNPIGTGIFRAPYPQGGAIMAPPTFFLIGRCYGNQNLYAYTPNCNKHFEIKISWVTSHIGRWREGVAMTSSEKLKLPDDAKKLYRHYF